MSCYCVLIGREAIDHSVFSFFCILVWFDILSNANAGYMKFLFLHNTLLKKRHRWCWIHSAYIEYRVEHNNKKLDKLMRDFFFFLLLDQKCYEKRYQECVVISIIWILIKFDREKKIWKMMLIINRWVQLKIHTSTFVVLFS